MPIISRDIPLLLQQWLDKSLEPHETLLWSGQPNSCSVGQFNSCYSMFVLAVVSFVGLIEFLFYKMALGSDPPTTANTTQLLSISILITPPDLALIAFMLSRPLAFRKEARRTLYALTNRRAIIALLNKGAVQYVVMAPLEIRNRTCRLGPDGTGTIAFCSARKRRMFLVDVVPMSPGFKNIQNVQQVDDLIACTFKN